MKEKNKPSDKVIKAIKIFEVGGNYNNDGKEILDNISEGAILVDNNSRFEGVLYKGDNAVFLSGYLSKDVISIDMLGKSINAMKQSDGSYLGEIEIDDQDTDEEIESPCRVILSNLKENHTIEKDRLDDVIYSLKNTRVMILERNIHK